MICTCLQGLTYPQILDILDNPIVEMAEVRLDTCELDDSETEELFSQSEKPLIATCRASGSISFQEAERRLCTAVQAGARFADLELEAPANISRHFQKVCRECGVELIRSYHNMEQTPDGELLEQILDRCYRYGASIAKIVTVAQDNEAAIRIAGLYEKAPRGRLIAFCLGEQYRDSRLKCLRKGAPFSYSHPDTAGSAAPGQWPLSEFSKEVYGEMKPYCRRSLRMPSSKSFAQRAIIAAALAEGTSHLGHYTPCDDSIAAIEVARKLGATVGEKDGTLAITGIGPVKAPIEIDRLDAGESGLLARLIIPLLATLGSGSFVIEGCRTLLTRQLSNASDIMAAFGVMVSNEDPDRGKTVYIPAKVRGNLIPGVADVPGNGGSQLISGLLMSLPLCRKPSTLYVSDPKSLPYMFITVDLLKHFGIRIESELEGDSQMLEQQDWSYCTGVTFHIKGGQSLKAADFDLEGDWSAAANYLVAGAVFGLAEIDNLDCASLQADLTITDILVEAGASVSSTEDGKVCICKAPLEAFTADLNNSPDLFPITAVLASFCEGRSTLRGIGRLRGKESDRASAIMEMLSGFGVNAEIQEDEIHIDGENLVSRKLNGRLLKGGKFSSRHDHRMVMALEVASLGADSKVIIDDVECISKSFPGFTL